MEKEGMIESLVDKALEGKRYLIDTLRENDYTVNAGEGNFIFIKPKTKAADIVKKMKEDKKILIKVYNGIGDMSDCLRVSTGDKEIMKIFLDALLEIDR